MRPIAAAFAALMTLALLAAPVAFAGGEEGPQKGRERAAEAKALRHDDNWTRGNGADDDHGNETDDEGAGDGHRRDGEHRDGGKSERRLALLESFREKMRAWRESWKENATAIREACHAVEPDPANATKEEHRAWAHCVRDGYHAFFEALRLERKAWRAEWKGSD